MDKEKLKINKRVEMLEGTIFWRRFGMGSLVNVEGLTLARRRATASCEIGVNKEIAAEDIWVMRD